MNKVRLLTVLASLTLFLTLFLAASGLPGIAANSAKGQPTDQIMIQFTEAVEQTQLAGVTTGQVLPALSLAAGVEVTYFRPMSGDAHVLKLPTAVAPKEAAKIAAKMAKLEGVVYAEPDLIKTVDDRSLRNLLSPDIVPNDPQFGNQWHYAYTAGTSEGLNLINAWNIYTGSPSTVVAVIDTGILNHTDLAGKVVGGYDFISDPFIANDGGGRDSDPSDPGDWILTNECGFLHGPQNSTWHGTHVSGTIGAATNNNLGVAGVNWNAKILPARVLGKCGGSTSDIVDAMRWSAGLPVAGVPANANPAQVLNLSLGGFGSCSISEQNAINEVVNAGTVVVVAAGNSNDDAANYSPASCNNVITVASTNRNGDKADYSNYGSVVEVSGPGGDTSILTDGVLSTLDGGLTVPNNDNIYEYYQGTSMASPHVAGLASLIMGLQPGYSPAQVLALLENTARPFPGGSSCNTNLCGEGIVDAYQALTQPNPGGISLYLPVGLKQYSPLPPPPNPIVNPGFESGSGVGWTEFSAQGWPLIINSGFPGSVTPHAGSWAVWLGGDDNEDAYIQQNVTVPAGAPYLAYWHWIASADICGFDFGHVQVNGVTVDQYNLCTPENTSGWVMNVVNLGAYAGQTVSLRIRATTDGSDNSNLFVDDVAFQASPIAAASLPSAPLAPGADLAKGQ